MRFRLKPIVSSTENVVPWLIKKQFLKLEKKKKKKVIIRMVNDNQTHSITMQVNSIYRYINQFMASPNSKLVIGKREIIQLIYMWFKGKQSYLPSY